MVDIQELGFEPSCIPLRLPTYLTTHELLHTLLYIKIL